MHPLRLFLIGMLMGLADLVPGISSGTVAYSLNIYKRWITALDSISVSKLLSFQLRDFVRKLDLKVLLPVLFGIMTSISIFTNLIFLILKNEPAKDIFFIIISFFLMLSCLSFSKEIQVHTIKDLSYIFYGIAMAVLISMIPVSSQENTNFLLIFFGASIAAFAMMLPGISGSSVLLLLNQYEFLISQVKDFIDSIIKFQFFNFSTAFVCIFLCGVIFGVATFSKLLKNLLENHSHKANLVLFGIMAGCIFSFVTVVVKIIITFALLYLVYKRRSTLVKS